MGHWGPLSSTEKVNAQITWITENHHSKITNIDYGRNHQSYRISLLKNIYIYAGWWVVSIPLENDGVRQLVLWHSQYMESHKNMFQTTNHKNIGKQTNQFSNTPPISAWYSRSFNRLVSKPPKRKPVAWDRQVGVEKVTEKLQRELTIHSWLVVDLPLWRILVSWDDCSQYMEK